MDRTDDRRDGADRRQSKRIVEFRLWMAIAVLGVLIPAVAYLELEWRRAVAGALEAGAAVSTQVAVIKVEAASNTRAIERLEYELSEQRRDQLHFYEFVYERLGARMEAAAARERAEALPAKQPSPSPPPPRPSPTPRPR